MPDCFISYSTKNNKIANFAAHQLELQQVSTFLAPISIQPGSNWTQAIWQNLKASPWVLFLASRTACMSPYVQQEIGGAIATGKTIIPVIWDINPHELPGWVSQIQVLDLRNRTYNDFSFHLGQLAKTIKAEKEKGAIIIGALIAGIILFAAKSQ